MADKSKRFPDYEMSSLRRIKNIDDELPEVIAARAADAALEACADVLKPKRRVRASKKVDKTKQYTRLISQQACLVSLVENLSASSFVFLQGEPGSGKSRMLSLLASHLSSTCTPYAIVSCDAKRNRAPFSVARCLLTSLCWANKVSPVDIVHRVFTNRPHLGLFPNVGGYLGVDLSFSTIPTVSVAYEDQQGMLKEIFIAWFEELVSARNLASVVCLVDNTEFCDPMWSPLLELLFTVPRSYRLNVVCAASINYEFSEATLRVCAAQKQTLRMLDTDDAHLLIMHEIKELLPQATSVTQELFEQLFFRGGGNPLFLVELVRLYHEGKRIQCDAVSGECSLVSAEGGGWALADSKLQDIVLNRFKSLPQLASQVLQEAAVVGFRVDMPMLRKITMVADLEALNEALNVLFTARIILPSPDSSSAFVFFNSLYQEVALSLLDSTHMERSLELHSRVAVSSCDQDTCDWAVIASHWIHVAENSPRNSQQSVSAAMNALRVLRKCSSLMRQVALNQASFMCIHCMLTMVDVLGDHPDANKIHLETLLQLDFSRKLSQLQIGSLDARSPVDEEDLAPKMREMLQLISNEQQKEVFAAHEKHCYELVDLHSWLLASVFAKCGLPMTVNAKQRLSLNFLTQTSLLLAGDLQACRQQCESDRHLWLAAGSPEVPSGLPLTSAVFLCTTAVWPLLLIAAADEGGLQLLEKHLEACSNDAKRAWHLLASLLHLLPYRIDRVVLVIISVCETRIDVTFGHVLVRLMRLYFEARVEVAAAVLHGAEIEEIGNKRPSISGYHCSVEAYIKAGDFDKARSVLAVWKDCASKKGEWRLYSEWHRLHAQLLEDEHTALNAQQRPLIEGTRVLAVMAILPAADVERMRSHLLEAIALSQKQGEKLLQCRAAVQYARLSMFFGRWEDDVTLINAALSGIDPKAAAVFEDVEQAVSIARVLHGSTTAVL